MAQTGIAGLDQALGGGFPHGHTYLIEGDPGSGKTTLALQFLLEGVRRNETCLYVTLGESRDELTTIAESHGYSLDGLEIVELTAAEADLDPHSSYTVFEAAEVELEETIGRIVAEVERSRPQRVVIDSLSEFRLLAQNPLRYRHQTLALKRFFSGRDCTVLVLDDRSSGEKDLDLHSITHGVVTLEQLAPEFGGAKRRMRVVKLRGRAYPGGWNDFHIERGGLNIFPRLQWERSDSKRETPLGSGIPELDQMLGGGVDAGTAVMMIGPTGTGKTTTIAQYVRMAADRNLRTAMFLFDERPFTMLTRLDGMDISIREDVGAGTVTLQQIEPAELTPSEFASVVKNAVEPPDGSTGASVVVIDSLNGYMLAMPEARFLTIHLHELLSFLAERNVFTFLTVAERGMIGPNPESAFDASYLADTVVNFRYFETDGEIQQTVSVVKRRTGNHERTLRKMSFGPHGITVGQPLAHLHGILTGVPVPSASFE